MNDYKSLYKRILIEYQNFSKCARLHVAALLVENGRILCCGYNGTPAGQCNCNELFHSMNLDRDKAYYYRLHKTDTWTKIKEQEWLDKHHEYSLENELHAEMNCITTAYKNNVPIEKCTMVISYMPCENCAKLIFCAGIKHVLFVNDYDRGSKAIEFLTKNGVTIEKI